MILQKKGLQQNYFTPLKIYTFLYFKRRLFESASFNVKRQLLLYNR